MILVVEARLHLFPGHRLQLVLLVNIHAAGSWITVARLHSLALSVSDIAPAVDLLWSSLHERTANVSGWRTGTESRLTLFGRERGSPSIHLDRPASH
jgi:hypothetical protein